MSTHVTITSCVLLVVLLCTLHLLLGVWIGSVFRGRWRFAAQATNPLVESLVVVLGNPAGLTFLVARVQYHRPEFIDGQRGYLVGCQFVRQVTEAYAWDANCGAIVSAAQGEIAIASC